MIRFDMLMQNHYELDVIRVEIENLSNRYIINHKSNILCEYDPANKTFKIELVHLDFLVILPLNSTK